MNMTFIDQLHHHLNRAIAIVGVIQESLPDNQQFDDVGIVIGMGREEIEACQRLINQLDHGSLISS